MGGNSQGILDPTLGPGLNLDARFRDIEMAEQTVAVKKQQLLKLLGQVDAEQQIAQPKSQTPVWDEIDSITSQMTSKEYEKLMQNEEFVESMKVIETLIQATQLAQLRPLIEGSQQGKDALDNHLTIIKRLKKSVSAEVDRELDDFQVYKEKFSDIPYSEYLKMKKSSKGE